MNTALFMLRAKQMGFSIAELDEVDEGFVTDMIIESANDLAQDSYRQLATQEDMDLL